MINSSSKEAPQKVRKKHIQKGYFSFYLQEISIFNILLHFESEKGGFNPPKESKVSKILTDITTKRVIILVLVLVFIMPLFSVDYYFDPPAPIEIAVKQM